MNSCDGEAEIFRKRLRKPSIVNISDHEDEPETEVINSKKSKASNKFSEIWQYYNRGPKVNNGHYQASCFHCNKIYGRGKPATMEAHLANECLHCPEEIRQYWRDKVANRAINYIRPVSTTESPYNPNKSLISDHFFPNKALPPAVTNRIDTSLIRAWVMAGLPFGIIENPFVIDLFKELNPSYNLPSRTTLSGRILDEELARVNTAIYQDLEKEEHLTLGKFVFIIRS
jgi:hypothetical protein